MSARIVGKGCTGGTQSNFRAVKRLYDDNNDGMYNTKRELYHKMRALGGENVSV